jgi:hypothetical protein
MKKANVLALAGLLVISLYGGLLGCDIEDSSDVTTQMEEVVTQTSTSSGEVSGSSTASAPSSQSGSAPASAPRAAPASAPPASSGGGGGGFLWKPVSEGDGNLVVLLPASMRGQVAAVYIQKGGSTVESGRFSGDTHNGGRPHYRFSQPGAGYGSGLTLVAVLKDGTRRSWGIGNGGQRVG